MVWPSGFGSVADPPEDCQTDEQCRSTHSTQRGGGLIPCPASITVLLICLQLKKFSLGATLVLGFSVGLALTLVASGAIAALSLKHATRRWPWLNDLSRKAPWFSGLLIIVVGIYMMLHGLSGL